MTINELRGVEHPINWYPPMAQSTYMGMTKRDLVDHLAVVYYNWLEAERAIVRVTSYAKKKCDQADKAAYSILPALDINLGAVASAHNTEYGDDPEFDRLYRVIEEVKRRHACKDEERGGYECSAKKTETEAISVHNRMARAVVEDVHGPRGL